MVDLQTLHLLCRPYYITWVLGRCVVVVVAVVVTIVVVVVVVVGWGRMALVLLVCTIDSVTCP